MEKFSGQNNKFKEGQSKDKQLLSQNNQEYLKKIGTTEQRLSSINKIEGDDPFQVNDSHGQKENSKWIKHVVLSMAEIKDHEIEKKKDPKS